MEGGWGEQDRPSCLQWPPPAEKLVFLSTKRSEALFTRVIVYLLMQSFHAINDSAQASRIIMK